MTEREPTLDDWRQMCDAPGDAYSAGEWCHAANDLLAMVDMLSHRADWVHPAEFARERERAEKAEGEIESAMASLREFNHVEGEPLSEVAAVAASAYGFAKHAEQSLRAELARVVAETDTLRAVLNCEHNHLDDSDRERWNWTYVEHEGETWTLCPQCGLLELWAGGTFIKDEVRAALAVSSTATPQ